MMKMMFWGLFAAGFVACSAFGIGPVLKRMGGDWLSAPMVAGIVLGVAILALAAVYVAGARPPFLATDRAFVIALAVLVGSKVVVGLLTTLPAIGRA